MSLATTGAGRSKGQNAVTYLLRDIFTTTRAAGSVDGTAAQPGPGLRDVTDVESVISTSESHLSGLHQPTSPVWGESRVVYPALAREPGRALFALVRPTDCSSDIAVGWATADNIADPRTDGHAWVMEDGRLGCATPGVQTLYQNDHHDIRPMHYLVGTVLGTTGAYVVLSTFGDDEFGSWGKTNVVATPAYPDAMIVYATRNGSDATLYPFVSALGHISFDYYLGNRVSDLRALDLGTDYDYDDIASFYDLFERADDATAIGNDWAADVGVWGISSNAAYCVSGSGLRAAWHDAGIANGIFQWTVTTPAANTQFQLIFRRVSAGNYLRVNCDMSGRQIAIQYITAGAFGGTIFATAKAWSTSTTYTVTVIASENKYILFVDDALFSSIWRTDAGSNHIAGTGMGIGSFATGANSPLFLDCTALPLTITLPVSVSDGAVPTVRPASAGAILAQDTFTDADGTSLADHTPDVGSAWTQHVGNLEINSNVAQCDFALGAGTEALCTQDVGQQNVEVSLEITAPSAWPAAPADLWMGEGVIGRYVDASHWIGFRCRADVAQTNEEEVEVVLYYPGHNEVTGKVYLGEPGGVPAYQLNTTYTLRVQFIGQLAMVFLDNKPVLSYVIPADINGTRFGLSQMDDGNLASERATLDNWIVKAL